MGAGMHCAIMVGFWMVLVAAGHICRLAHVCRLYMIIALLVISAVSPLHETCNPADVAASLVTTFLMNIAAAYVVDV